ncbi:hypothetical protein LCGC14_2517210 [marine sediment metagenome]|uniref:Uncharacterized protein n=1 Tax=marine sediment metagenome TaxID=412755 RepID=A0A0F9AXF1_9ZZZZ
MRAYDLTELKLATTYPFKIYQNPHKNDFKVLVKKLKALRGIIDNKNLYVWNARDLIHDSVVDQLQLKKPKFLFFASKEIYTDEWYTRSLEINDIWVGSNTPTDLKHPMVQKALGIK